MAYKGYIATMKNVRPHPNADRLKLADIFGNTVCVGLEAEEGSLCVYFPVDGRLSEKFCEVNHMCRKKKDGTPDTGYLDPDKRNIKAIKLRGEKSDGICLPLTCLKYTGADITSFNEGDIIDVVNGHEICEKYIPRQNISTLQNRPPKEEAPTLFKQHVDTEQLAYNLSAFKPGDEIEITLKVHGTSGRTAYVPMQKDRSFIFDSFLKYYLYKIIPFEKWRLKFVKRFCEPNYEYDYISGTRRTAIKDYKTGGFYGSNLFRKKYHDFFMGKLWKGETVYYEIAGFTHDGAPIMAKGDNNKLGKDFVKKYGETTIFSYGCDQEKCESDIYVYRMTMINEDGEVVEYSPHFMRYRCEQMGVKTVPVFWKGIIPEISSFESAGEWVKTVAEKYYDGVDPIGKTHIREGVVVRIVNRPTFCAFKHKNYDFKMLSGIITESVANGDITVDESIIEEL